MKVFKKLVFLVLLVNFNSFALANNSDLSVEENKQIGTSGVSFDEFKKLSLNTNRCVAGISDRDCNSEMFYALNENLISKQTFDWAYENRFFPIISSNGSIVAVCPC